jgi:hypothetical protein
MKLPALLAAAGLLSLAAVGHSQAPPATTPPAPAPLTPPHSYVPSGIPRAETPPPVDLAPGVLPPAPADATPRSVYQPIPTPGVPPQPPEQTVEQVLDALEKLKGQMAELQKREQVLTDLLNKKLDEQSARVKKLGVTPKRPPAIESTPEGVPDAVAPITETAAPTTTTPKR